jgi:hypothetical protein
LEYGLQCSKVYYCVRSVRVTAMLACALYLVVLSVAAQLAGIYNQAAARTDHDGSDRNASSSHSSRGHYCRFSHARQAVVQTAQVEDSLEVMGDWKGGGEGGDGEKVEGQINCCI